jgi:threonine-phosphate decarboxylase
MLNGHGDDIQQNVLINFSSNVFYEGCNPDLINHIFNSLHRINRYPEVMASDLQHNIAKFHHVSPKQILPVNGAVEAIYLIAQAFRGKTTTIFTPTFSEYEDACIIHQHKIKYEPFTSLTDNNQFNSGLIFLCNPNNPTGKALPQELIFEIIKNNPNTLFVIDEAYEAFTLVDTTCTPFIDELNNLIIIKSLTKRFSIPGLRLGYIISNQLIIDKLLHYKMPWTVNALAIEAGNFIFNNLISTHFPINQTIEETQWLRNTVSKIPGMNALPSDTSFFLCELENQRASHLKNYLINQHGILIRDASNFRGLNPGHFRLATQKHEHNMGLIKALQQWTVKQ